MKVKMLRSMAGVRFSLRPRQIVECTAKRGKLLIDSGTAIEAPEDSEAEAKFPELGAVRDRGDKPRINEIKETATLGTPETAVTDGEPARCKGTTTLGNPCKKAPVSGSSFCAKHQAGG